MDSGDLTQLEHSRERFLSFVRARVADPDRAEDILQASLLKAVEHYDRLQDEASLVPWFLSILRNTIIDSYRSRAGGHEVPLPDSFEREEETDLERKACECFEGLLPALKPEYAHLISALDLGQEAPSSVAHSLGITANNLKVRHHRARQALKQRLQETCRLCAEHHCLDCTCRSDSLSG